MVFSSIPAYLDPSNWNQQQNHQIIGSSSANPLLPPPPHPGPPPPPPPSQPHGGGSIRPGSMAERARMANMPLPETSLKCPRCESTNTKFCYFNNYSLSQPRHFCKTCRRYWTRGGALRNVPVGGGCRRNKRSKSSTSSSKSPASSDRQTNATSTSTVSTNSGAPNLLGLTPPQFPPLRFMSPLGQFTDNFATDMGLSNYTGMPSSTGEMSFHGATNLIGGGGGGVASLLSTDSGGIEPWRLQQVHQFPFLGGGGLDTSSQGIYQFHGGESGFLGGSEMSVRPRFSSPMTSQRPPVKMEESGERRQILGGGNEQWNGGNTANWTELSSFSSSSTSNPL